MTGYATSVIACDAEAGIERELAADETPDGRPGFSILVFAFSRDALEKALANRVGQCVMTCPTTACYNGLPLGEKTIVVGRTAPLLRRRLADLQEDRRPAVLADPGDGRRVPLRGDLRDGQGRRRRQHHRAWARSRPRRSRPPSRPSPPIRRECRDVILPFPGGIARSGSKVGSKYKGLRASTNTAFAPTLRGVVPTELPPDARCAYEIVIDGLSLEAVERATAVGRARPPPQPDGRRRDRGQLRRQPRAVPHPPASMCSNDMEPANDRDVESAVITSASVRSRQEHDDDSQRTVRPRWSSASLARSEDRRIAVHPIEGGGRYIDCGIERPGGLLPGVELARICLAGLAQSRDRAGRGRRAAPITMIQVVTDHPVRACLASQYAGWAIKEGKYFAMGSGPMRAAAGTEAIYDIDRTSREHRTSSSACSRPASRRLPRSSGRSRRPAGSSRRRSRCSSPRPPAWPAACRSSARSVETALHKLAELKFDLSRIVSAHGTAPLPPVAADDLAAIGRTNDAILYGAG